MHIYTVVALGKFKIRIFQGVSGCSKHHLGHFCLFFWDFLSFQFSTLGSCWIWFTINSEYSSAYVYSCCPEKFKIRVCQGVSQGVQKPYFEQFLPICWDFLPFSSFFGLESCYSWYTISIEYPSCLLYTSPSPRD